MSDTSGDEVIRSAQNSRLKLIRRLQKDRKTRQETGLGVVEGPKVIKQLLVEPGFIKLEAVYVVESSHEEIIKLCRQEQLPVFPVQKKLLDEVADTKTFSGILATFNLPTTPPEEATASSVVLAFNGIGDPGNAGTLIRSAFAFGVQHLVLIENNVDIFSPKVLRSTMGSFAYIQYHHWTLTDFEKNRKNFQVVATTGAGQTELERSDRPLLLVIGNESAGISDEILAAADDKLRIVMEPGCESLNAAIAGSILLERFYRQSK